MNSHRLGESFTAFPNELLDEVMPKLTDTEWRLLCVLVRQTVGWHTRDGARKSSDWLSHSQLKKRTGRASAAVSRAIDGLVKRGLIDVTTLAGVQLSTAQQRRAAQQKMVFRVRDSHTYPAKSIIRTSEN